MEKSTNALEAYLAAGHQYHCVCRARGGDPDQPCNCGHDEALKEFEKMRDQLLALQQMIQGLARKSKVFANALVIVRAKYPAYLEGIHVDPN